MAISRTTYANSTVRFDYAIDGVPFFAASDDDSPYLRDTADWMRDSLDITAARGEQSLSGWWYRSQSSFHGGAGLTFFDPRTTDDVEVANQFADSLGVDVWTPGQVKLQRSTQSVQSLSGTAVMDSYEIGGATTPMPSGYEQGILVGYGSTLKRFNTAGGSGTIDYGTSGTPSIFDVMVRGPRYYVGASDGLYAGSFYDWLADQSAPTGPDNVPGDKIYDITDGNFLRMGWIKERFIVGLDNSLYECAIDKSPGADPLPAAFYSHALNGWRWTGFADGPDSIYFSGWRGRGESAVYASTLETSEAGATPTLSVPYVVATMPYGERIHCMASYMGTYLILGTDLGIRVCIIGNDGQITLGPLSCETDRAVTSLTCSGKFCWFAGSVKDGKNGLYRLDLSMPTQDLEFPWARDIYETAGGRDITSCAAFGTTDRIAFASSGGDVMVEDDTERVSSGYLTTGKIRFNTWEKKIPQFLRVASLPSTGSITPSLVPESGTPAALDTVTMGSSVYSTDIDGTTDGQPHQWWAYKFTLTQSGGSSNTPLFAGYQVMSNPSGVKPRSLRIPLMCSYVEAPAFSRRVSRSSWDRIVALEALEASGEVVVFQDFGTGEQRLVVVDRVQFVRTNIPEVVQERTEPTGRIVLTLRTVD